MSTNIARARTMRKFRGAFRLLLSKAPYLPTALKIVTIFCVIMARFWYLQAKYEKEVLIELALGNGVSDERVKPDNDTLVFNGLLEDGVQKGENAFVVIAVHSLPENLAKRDMIRRTWASTAEEHGAVVVFFLGVSAWDIVKKTLIKEASQYNDMVIDDFQESYYALAIKTLRVLKYFKFHHIKSKFLVKTDDDMFVNVPNLVHYCYEINKRFDKGESGGVKREGEANREYFLGGVIHSDRGPHTWNPFTKWYVPPDLWNLLYTKVLEEQKKVEGGGESTNVMATPMNEERYPPYAEGGFYVLSSDAAIDILDASKSLPLFHLEDVHVTGVLASWMLRIEKENIPFITNGDYPKFSYFWYKLFTASPKDIIAFHCDKNVDLISIIYNESKE